MYGRLSKPLGSVALIAAAALASGLPVQIPDGRAGIVAGLSAVAAGDLYEAYTLGQFTVPKTANIVILDGGRVYWDRSAATATFKADAGSGDFYLGTAVGDAAATDTEVVVELNARQRVEIELGTGIWDTAIVKTAGTPVATRDTGGSNVKLAFDTQAEAQKADLLSRASVPVAVGCIMEARFAIYDIGDAAALDFNIGLANATHASDADAITQYCFFHFDGASLNIMAQSADGTTTVASVDTTIDAVDDTYLEVWIDARNKADIQLYVNGVNVLPASVFKLDAATGPLKALAHLEKSADDTPGEVRVESMAVRVTDVA